ncbi:MAG: branched-chain amino acid ABC transporter permease [Thermoleophilia bacterium]
MASVEKRMGEARDGLLTGWWSKLSVGGVAAVLLVLIAQGVLNSYWLGILTLGLVFGLFAMGLDVLVGWCGLASLGHAAFFGTSGYVLAIMTTRWGVSPWVAAGLGVAAGTLLAALFAPLAVRVRGLTFLTVTLAAGQIVWGVALKWREVTGGSDGIPGVPRPELPGGISLMSSTNYFVLTGVVVFVVAAALSRVMAGPLGLQLNAARQSDLRLRSLGYHVGRLRVVAFVISAAVASVAGILVVFFNQFAGTNIVDWRLSAQMLLAVVIGGPGSLWGPFFAGFGLYLLQVAATNLTERWTLILGLLYITAVLVIPRGLGPVMGNLGLRLRRGLSRGSRA